MKARYQYRFYPTNQQRQNLARLFGCVRVVWNDALALCKQSESVAGERTRLTKLPSNINKVGIGHCHDSKCTSRRSKTTTVVSVNEA
ncbi:helix-turn-helix domain-containing protein [Nostoc sp. BAE]|nr:helix-turn-helix domain-containing protein [Nostoc commune]MBG1257752.1 helix-turn-helix domain-containing protein [Nostoc commune BAE]